MAKDDKFLDNDNGLNDESDDNPKPRNEQLFRAYRDEFKRKEPHDSEKNSTKSSEVHKNKSRLNFNLKKSAPYLLVLAGFFGGIFIIAMIMDQWVIPAIVHNRENVSIPNVEGKTLPQATNLLTKMNLTYEVSSEQFNDNVEKGRIIRQLPAAATKVKSGRPVYLTISKGSEKVIVPMLRGKSIREARVTLMSSGLILGKTSYQNSEEIPKDSVVSQSIKPGVNVEYGDTVNVVVSLGSELTIEMPYLIGTRIEDVQAILEAKGLELANINYERSETFMPNTIIEQSPFQFSDVQKGSPVSITVAK